MTATNSFAVCRCFYTANIFVPQWQHHVSYTNRDQFFHEFSGYTTSQSELEHVANFITNEIERRKNLHFGVENRRDQLRRFYPCPKYSNIYQVPIVEQLAPEFLSLQCIPVSQDDIFRIGPVFTPAYCAQLRDEIDNIKDSGLKCMRPNSMNKDGIILDEVGFLEFFNEFRQMYLEPLIRKIYPDFSDENIDSHKAFIVKYKEGNDIDLPAHFDNSELTLNVCLSPDDSYEGGELFFPSSNSSFSRGIGIQHRYTQGIIHRGSRVHLALPISGQGAERQNLIIWLRISSIRNIRCPMCSRSPDLIPAPGFGDGFVID